MKLSKVKEMRNLDKQAIEEFGIPQNILMENAGLSVSSVIYRALGVDNRFVVFCGGGNNGGDGFVVARKLHSNGANVKVVFLSDEERLKGAAKKNFEIISGMLVEIKKIESVDEVESAVINSDVIVDAILGTGITRDVEGLYRDVIQLINDSGKKVVSVDIPSGVNGDTGESMGVSIDADITVTFGLPKVGNLLYPGYSLTGDLHVSHISFPPTLYDSDSIKVEIFDPIRLPKRYEDTHKGDYGKGLFVAGASSYLGAPYFSSLSFLKAGGGLSYLATPKTISPFIANKGSEVVIKTQSETESGSIAIENKEDLLEFSSATDIVVMGPGVSLNDETQELVRQLADEINVPLLIDGDGITAISKDLDVIRKRDEIAILTPHPGEMSRITNKSIKQIEKNRIDVLQEATEELDSIIVLKGARSLTGYPDGRVILNVSGNPGMATAGSGDVLTGTIAAMYGIGLSVEDAVPAGVFLHGLSGDLAAADKGENGITAQDVMDYLPRAFEFYKNNFENISEDFYGSVKTV